MLPPVEPSENRFDSPKDGVVCQPGSKAIKPPECSPWMFSGGNGAVQAPEQTRAAEPDEVSPRFHRNGGLPMTKNSLLFAAGTLVLTSIVASAQNEPSQD